MTADVLPSSTTAGELVAASRFRIIRRLGVGGMAEVFLAQARGIESFEKAVVLKRILPHLAAEGRFIRMFLEEARLAATLHHLNIAQVFEIGRTDDTYFYTMEYIDGVDLAALLRVVRARSMQVPLEAAVAIAIGVAAGLHYAHEKQDPAGRPLGLVHRDVSPSNVMVARDGGVKLLDFGIAKAADSRLDTRPGEIKGKVPYMSPEQCRCEPVDRRTDVFSLGLVLYELTTGERLLAGSSDAEVLRVLDRDALPLAPLERAGYPPELRAIVLRALQKDPAERYATARELQLDLEAFARTHHMNLSPSSLGSWVQSIIGATPERILDSAPVSDLERSHLTRSLLGGPGRTPRLGRAAAVVLGAALALALILVLWATQRRVEPQVARLDPTPAPPAAIVPAPPAKPPPAPKPSRETRRPAAPRRDAKSSAAWDRDSLLLPQ